MLPAQVESVYLLQNRFGITHSVRSRCECSRLSRARYAAFSGYPHSHLPGVSEPSAGFLAENADSHLASRRRIRIHELISGVVSGLVCRFGLFAFRWLCPPGRQHVRLLCVHVAVGIQNRAVQGPEAPLVLPSFFAARPLTSAAAGHSGTRASPLPRLASAFALPSPRRTAIILPSVA